MHLELLRAVERRVLWLSTAMVDHANRVSPNPSGLKVGGHQASSASMASIMTALWFSQLTRNDRLAVKPHASPALHAINHLLGELDASYLTSLRAHGGLQAYPSRSKDPDPVDYTTGSMGTGATAPIWGAIARRYVNGQRPGGATGRQYALVGDASVLDGHPHTLAFLGGVNSVPAVALGVTRFGSSGTLADACREHGFDADAIVAAALGLTG